MGDVFRVFVTFDLDCTAYTKNWDVIDEFSIVSNSLFPLLKFNDIKATWFVRLDRKVEKDFGKPDFFLRRYSNIIEKLLDEKHEFGWHPHVYTLCNDKWVQNINEKEIISELSLFIPLVRKYNLNIVRLGWGYVTNRIMKFLDDEGFFIDSSAIPRPAYKWDQTRRDWTITGNEFYHPSKTDYRVTSMIPDNNLNILEIPMTTMKIRAPYDSGEVIRYCNLSFYNDILKEPLDLWMTENNYLVTISHPYEIDDKFGQKNSLISFDLSEFSNNITYINFLAERYSKNIVYKILSDQRT